MLAGCPKCGKAVTATLRTITTGFFEASVSFDKSRITLTCKGCAWGRDEALEDVCRGHLIYLGTLNKEKSA